MSGPAVPGRFSFRFSRQPYHVTVDYTVQGRAVEGRPQVCSSVLALAPNASHCDAHTHFNHGRSQHSVPSDLIGCVLNFVKEIAGGGVISTPP